MLLWDGGDNHSLTACRTIWLFEDNTFLQLRRAVLTDAKSDTSVMHLTILMRAWLGKTTKYLYKN